VAFGARVFVLAEVWVGGDDVTITRNAEAHRIRDGSYCAHIRYEKDCERLRGRGGVTMETRAQRSFRTYTHAGRGYAVTTPRRLGLRARRAVSTLHVHVIR